MCDQYPTPENLLLWTQDLASVARCCPGLTSLNISSCRSVQPTSLSSFLPTWPQPSLQRQHHMHRLQHVHTPRQLQWAPAGQLGLEGSLQLPLSSLDVSYCNLTTQAVVDLLLRGCSLKVCRPTCLSLCHFVDAKCAGDVRFRVFFQP